MPSTPMTPSRRPAPAGTTITPRSPGQVATRDRTSGKITPGNPDEKLIAAYGRSGRHLIVNIDYASIRDDRLGGTWSLVVQTLPQDPMPFASEAEALERAQTLRKRSLAEQEACRQANETRHERYEDDGVLYESPDHEPDRLYAVLCPDGTYALPDDTEIHLNSIFYADADAGPARTRH